MSTLDETIREAVRNGLRGLTLWPAGDGRFQGNATFDGTGWRIEFDADPVEALKRALGASGMSEVTNDNDGQDVFG